jgi:hypothetical protein
LLHALPLSIARADQKCARFEYGIFPNFNVRGLLDHGAEIKFRRWGQLESQLGFGAGNVWDIRKAVQRDRQILAMVNAASRALSAACPTRRLNGAYNLAREYVLRDRVRPSEEHPFDEFLVQVFHSQDEPAGLVLEVVQARASQLSPSPWAHSRHNTFHIPFAEMQIDLADRRGLIRLYPDRDAELRLLFYMAGFCQIP